MDSSLKKLYKIPIIKYREYKIKSIFYSSEH